MNPLISARRRAAAFAAWGQKCQVCGTTEKLVAVSKDNDDANLSPDNLLVLCRPCLYQTRKVPGNVPHPACKRGHPFVQDSYWSYPRKNGGVLRVCKECTRLRGSAAYRKGEVR